MFFLRHLPTAARLLLGTVFLVIGSNWFLKLLPLPPLAGAAAAFIGALTASGYVMPLVKAIEVVAAGLLLGNRFVPLALALLAPIIVNIVAYHAVLEPNGMPISVIVLALELGLAWSYRHAFAPMLRGRVEPAAPAALPRLSTPASTAT